MKIYYIEDNLFHQELFKKELQKHEQLRSIEIHVFPSDKLETIYRNLETFSISSSDFFIIDIDLKTLHSGIDFAQKIRTINKNCYIIFLSNDSSRGLEIINRQIRPDRYLDKSDFVDVFNQIEEILQKKMANRKQNASIVELQGAAKVFLVDPDEVNYIATVNGSRSTLEYCGVQENFIIHDKMKNIKQKFKPYHYFNELKSYSINPFNIKNIDKQMMEVNFKNGESLFLSSTSIKKLMNHIEMLKQKTLNDFF
ncbi:MULTISPECIES: LytTR family transcriptional regulator DNA-binding domain-containing protein [unclassified Enterococcus]|uniref:LytTR family transcriptional regulator DNA-binding domain-containing protein n=1 Tax=unclassified Enterococcus TaxID=2608891 RepID=UPI0013EE2600|nr:MULTISPECIES: LytTR family transcriptional regulator DNA-binding domain-containing protein [unclassified Enterococcus]